MGGKRIVAPAGTSVFGPREVPHAFRNFTDENVEVLAVVTPADFGGFFVDSQDAKGPEDFLRLMSKYAVIPMGPQLEQ